MSTAWVAPVADGPVRGTVRVSGSKSVTNRALLLAALADGPSVLRAPLRSRDTVLMAAALRALGTSIVDGPEDAWLVKPAPAGWRGGAQSRGDGIVEVDCGLAGTVMRFVPPAAALAGGPVRFDGDPRARERPMDTMLAALRALGVTVNGDALPFVVRGAGRVPGGVVTMDASASSQFVSGLLLAGARYEHGVLVRHEGRPLPSLPHIEMTVHMLRSHGVVVDTDGRSAWRVEPGPVKAQDWDVEPDLSNAAVYLAAAAVTGGSVTVPGWPAETTQAGDRIRGILSAMGCEVWLDQDGLTVHGPSGPSGPTGPTAGGPPSGLAGVDLDLHDAGELAPTVAALAALAGDPSTLRGIAHLRGHETDRLAALATGLGALGCDVEETADGLRIRPRPLHGGVWRAHADHRMATAGAIIGLVVPGVEVDDIGCTGKTIPDFPEVWRTLVARSE